MSVNPNWRFLLVACGLCVAVSTWALNSDKRQPINIQADHADFTSDASTNNGTGVYTGHVIITQGSIRITADKAILHMLNGQIQSADITGTPATFQQQPDTGALSHGNADHITYDASTNEVDLMGDAHVQQGEREIAGDVIHYNTATEHVMASGGKTSGGRIHVTIPPKQPVPPPAHKELHQHRDQSVPESTPPPSHTTHSEAP